jgi:hypothetical protein
LHRTLKPLFGGNFHHSGGGDFSKNQEGGCVYPTPISSVSGDSFCFFSPGHEKVHLPRVITLAWQVVGAHAGVKVLRLHDARHTHESLWLKLGIHPETVQERLGHSSIRMTLDVDSHVVPGLQEAAALRFAEPLTANHENGVVEKGG